MRSLIYTIIILCFLVACDANRVYEDYKTIDASGWHKDSVLSFDFTIEEPENYNLYINIRNKGNYPNSNIWLFLELEEPDGQLRTDTVEYILAERSGKWTGSGIGDLFDNQFIYRKNVNFGQPGEYKFNIMQGMRAVKLKGIHDVGFRIEKQNN